MSKKPITNQAIFDLLIERLPFKSDLESLRPESLESVMASLNLCMKYLEDIKTTNILVAKTKIDTAMNLIKNEIKG